ncbi:MAG: PAS domain S-box protein [Syntrophales bacterium]|nr:PAS domain S-box protein [Syntrophales bacterium]
MNTSHTGGESETPAVALRRRAEGIARGKTFRIPENMESLSIEATRQMLHELRVHQIELEMQNEELRRAQEELNAARARYFDLYDLAAVGYFTLSEKGLILEANLTAATLLGVARGALVKQPIFRFLLPEDQDIYYRHRTQLFETHLASSGQAGEPQACELRLVKTDGTAFWGHLAATAAQDADGAPVCRVVLSDITDRKQAEEALRESEEKYRWVVDNMADVIMVIDMNLRFTYVSPSIMRIRGYTAEEATAQTFEQVMTPESLQIIAKVFEEEMKLEASGTADPGRSRILELELYRKDGSIVWMENNLSFIRDEAQKPVSIISLSRDITDRKRAEEGLRASEENYRRSLDESPLGIRTVSKEGATLYTNRATLDIFGYDSIKEWQTTHAVKRYTEQSYAEFKVRREKRRLGEDDSSEYGIDIVRKDGEVRHLQVWRKRVLWNGKEHYQVIYRDITDRKRADEELQQTLESLRKAVGTTIQVMVSAVETRDPYTAGHQVRSANLARTIAAEMGLPQEKIDGIRIAGSIHDIGKLSIPAEILSKPTKLSEIEFSLIKEHARQGYEILRNVESPWSLAEMVYQHHERMDGSGYPRGLKGEEILIEARILAVSDVVESMASHRPYRAGLGINAALEEIEKNRGTLYDEAVADACLRLFREKGYRFAER